MLIYMRKFIKHMLCEMILQLAMVQIKDISLLKLNFRC